MDIDYINKRIEKEICENTINMLKDDNLLENYKNCKSVKKNINILKIILDKYNIKDKIKNSIISDYFLKIIPAGTKGIVRGNKFNDIVRETINNLKLDNNRFEICFEKMCDISITPEIPDWYILEKETNKVIIGMNQLDVWNGGQQRNRGSKYLIDCKNNTEKSKLLCVVCNKIKLTSNKNKIYKLFKIGYSNDTLCYVKNIGNIINNFFNN